MLEFVIMLVIVGFTFASLMALCDWMAENNRVPFFVKAYRDWSRAEGEYRIYNIKNSSNH